MKVQQVREGPRRSIKDKEVQERSKEVKGDQGTSGNVVEGPEVGRQMPFQGWL